MYGNKLVVIVSRFFHILECCKLELFIRFDAEMEDYYV